VLGHQPVLASAIGQLSHPNRSAWPTFGKLLLGKLSLGNCCPWENAFVKVPNTV